MDLTRAAFYSLTQAACRELTGLSIPKKPVWTVVSDQSGTPYVALDTERLSFSDIRFVLSLNMDRLPEYMVLAEAIERDSGFKDGVLVDAGGFLLGPEKYNFTRGLVANFLWMYLDAGRQLNWDERRFDETFEEMKLDLLKKSIVTHVRLPLSNLRVGVEMLNFGSELQLAPATVGELERWINQDRFLPTFGGGPPNWDTSYIDRPAVLHARRTIVGRPRPIDPLAGLGPPPQFNVDEVLTALRLVTNAPISVIFQEQENEGLMAMGGVGMSWGWSPSWVRRVATLDQEKADEVSRLWQLLRTSPNSNILKVPLRRWESSLLRPILEDKLIDVWIALESLLLRGKPGELTYRATLRLAEMLGIRGDNRKDIYRNAKDSYKWRSVIVHALSLDEAPKRQSLVEAVEVTTGYLRSTLLKVLEMPSKFDADELESELLGREGTEPVR